MPNDAQNALLIVADYHDQKAPTCIHIPRQIPRAELLKLLPEKWVTDYEQIKKRTVPIPPIQSTVSTFSRDREGAVTIKFDRSSAKEPAPPPIFPTMFMVQPVPRRKKPEPLNKMIHSFDGYGNPTYFFRDPQSQHCYWDVAGCPANCGCEFEARCPADCDCEDCVTPNYSKKQSRSR
ncbi:hypothetical protein MLD38_011172 [Melastoma candidum]|uniref:Uncharacterized protein n=1 Tax=Melastoma candidum TaxID=119954 RepID=A0ACB9R3B9_9MYRT|nr:hypothetical protein MLD38_011172 [Melastoma candidum]